MSKPTVTSAAIVRPTMISACEVRQNGPLDGFPTILLQFTCVNSGVKTQPLAMAFEDAVLTAEKMLEAVKAEMKKRKDLYGAG